MTVQSTLKLQNPSSSNFEPDPSCKTTTKTKPNNKKLLRVIFTDHNATDSESSGDDETPRRVKKEITNITMQFPSLTDSQATSPSSSSCSINPTHLNKPRKRPTKNSGGSNRRSIFRGVRKRPSGRWISEIRDPFQRKRLWLGTFNTEKEAAAVYDAAAAKIYGPKVAAVNFPNDASDKKSVKVSPEIFSGDGFASPTSVLPFCDGETPFDGLRYGAVDAFGFDIDAPLNLTDVNFVPFEKEKEEFGEFDLDEVLTWPS